MDWPPTSTNKDSVSHLDRPGGCLDLGILVDNRCQHALPPKWVLADLLGTHSYTSNQKHTVCVVFVETAKCRLRNHSELPSTWNIV